MIRTAFAILAFAIWASAPATAQQEAVFIQVEARTSLTVAQQSAREYAARLDGVNGFALGGGWYGIALGPYTRDEAGRLLTQLRAQGAIPPDSYLQTAASYGPQFWPAGASRSDTLAAAPTPAPDVSLPEEPVVRELPDPEPAPAVSAPQETVAEARASERDLTRQERDEIQIALQWAGYYRFAIDGAFGRGTRDAMAAWQSDNGFEPTGVLTTRQRALLLQQYNAVFDGLGFALYVDPRLGIQAELPLGILEFDRYEAPFGLFAPTGEPAARVLLISQSGDRQTMNGLYEIMQTLEIVPLNGARERQADGFVLTGENDDIVSHTEVGLARGEIKGFTLIWPAGDEARRSRVLDRIRDGFARIPGVLEASAVTGDGQAVDLVSGLRVRQPRDAGSGFFVDDTGRVLTSLALVDGCTRVTLDDVHEARIAAREPGVGLALLQPEDRLAPPRAAVFSEDVPRLQSEIAVAGYSFGGVLGAPTLTFGTLEDLRDLAGNEARSRLSLSALPGDTGGPVYDQSGAVLGVLLPDQGADGRRLPGGVRFSARADRILPFLRDAGLRPATRASGGAIAPEDLTAQAAEMTVLVSCWD